jgi:hypothetical protein
MIPARGKQKKNVDVRVKGDNMNVIIDQQKTEPQAYITRIQQFFEEIENWLKDEALYIEQQEIEITEKMIGTYTVPSLSISTQHKNKLADIIPAGANIIVGEGRIDVDGWFGTEYIVFMRKNSTCMMKNVVGQDKLFEYPIYKGIDGDNWYWIDDTRRRKVSVMNKELLLELITMVSDYEFESA